MATIKELQIAAAAYTKRTNELTKMMDELQKEAFSMSYAVGKKDGKEKADEVTKKRKFWIFGS